MTRNRRIFSLCVAAGCLLGAVLFLCAPYLQYEAHMIFVRFEIWEGEMGWADRGATRVDKLVQNAVSISYVTERLLEEKDASLVAEGMVSAVRSKHPQRAEIVSSHLADDRWNWAMSSNSHVARQLRLYEEKGSESVEPFIMRWIRMQ